MPWIHVIPYDDSEGSLRQQYDAALKRAGRIWNIVSIMSQNPDVMKASMNFYLSILYAPSPLSRAQREMLALVTSTANRCTY